MGPTSQQHKVFVGLGNPGPKYEMTRHNMGYLVVKALARELGWSFKDDKHFDAFVAKGSVENTTLHLVLPKTYMNLSGTAVKRYLDFFKLQVDCLVVVVDDIALPFGQLRLKALGSAGGHNGLKSLETHLGTSEYLRLRMGIGHPGEKILADYVLDAFNREELENLVTFVDRGTSALKRLLTQSVAQVMNAINATPQQKDVGGERKDLTNPP